MSTTMSTEPDETEIAAQVDRLVDAQRMMSLWFLRPDYYPSTRDERVRVLEQIERHTATSTRIAGRLRSDDGSHGPPASHLPTPNRQPHRLWRELRG